jgi:hypothetical protein
VLLWSAIRRLDRRRSTQDLILCIGLLEKSYNSFDSFRAKTSCYSDLICLSTVALNVSCTSVDCWWVSESCALSLVTERESSSSKEDLSADNF